MSGDDDRKKSGCSYRAPEINDEDVVPTSLPANRIDPVSVPLSSVQTQGPSASDKAPKPAYGVLADRPGPSCSNNPGDAFVPPPSDGAKSPAQLSRLGLGTGNAKNVHNAYRCDGSPIGSKTKSWTEQFSHEVSFFAKELPKVVYRGDSRPPEEIFEQGFRARGSGHSYSAAQHIGLWGSESTGFISTSRDSFVAHGFARDAARDKSEGYVYAIRINPNTAIDFNSCGFTFEELYSTILDPAEKEVGIKDQIPPEDILGVELEDRCISNPNSRHAV